MKKSLKFFILVAAFAFMPYMNVHAETKTVSNQDELKAAVVDNTVDTIVLGGDIETTEKINIMRPLTIDGANYTITYTGTAYAYVLQFYMTTGTLKNIKLTGADGGLLVNGSVVTLEGTIDVSGNNLGGIEMGKGANVEAFPDIDMENATIVNTTENSNAPTVWCDISLDELNALEDDSDEESDAEFGPFKGVAYLLDKNQMQMFLDRDNVPTGDNVIDVSDEFTSDDNSPVVDDKTEAPKKEDNVASKNPNTYDSTVFYLVFAFISFMALGYSYTKATSR